MCAQGKEVFLITGATGFIGSLLVQALVESGKSYDLMLPIRNIEKANAQYTGLAEKENVKLHFFEVPVEDVRILDLAGPIDYIIHCASATQSSEMTAHPVETADGIVAGTKNILELARRKSIRSMVYLSSMEVYGRVHDIGRPRQEDELGEIDLSSVRSCYPVGKRMAEHYCHIYHQEYHVPVKIARLAQTFGRGVRLDDSRVYMQFARAAFEGRDIVLCTRGQSMGNYCSSDDVVRAVFKILECGLEGEVYNVVNEANTMRIYEMARLVASQVAGGKINIKFEPEKFKTASYAPDTELRLSGEKLRRLGWQAEKGLAEMYAEVIRELECSQSWINSLRRLNGSSDQVILQHCGNQV